MEQNNCARDSGLNNFSNTDIFIGKIQTSRYLHKISVPIKSNNIHKEMKITEIMLLESRTFDSKVMP